MCNSRRIRAVPNQLWGGGRAERKLGFSFQRESQSLRKKLSHPPCLPLPVLSCSPTSPHGDWCRGAPEPSTPFLTPSPHLQELISSLSVYSCHQNILQKPNVNIFLLLFAAGPPLSTLIRDSSLSKCKNIFPFQAVCLQTFTRVVWNTCTPWIHRADFLFYFSL